MLEELDGLEVLVAAVLVRDILLSAVIPVEHRRYSINTDTVEMILIEPVDNVGDEERYDLVLGIVKYICAPLPVLADPGICILVAGSSVKSYKTFKVLREMSRYPVKYDRDAVLMEHIDHELEVRRGTES